MKKPRALRRGDRVAIISPSGPVPPERVEGAIAALRQWGYEPVVGQHALCQCRQWGAVQTAGTDDERFADLLWAITDVSIKAIWCSRGGYGAVRLLERIDRNLVWQHRKWLIGFSDICALHALWSHGGVMSLHAPMAKHLSEHGIEGEVSEAIHTALSTRKTPVYHVPPHELNRSGAAFGKLVGGNLAVLTALLKSDFDVMRKSKSKTRDILFIEDVGEEIYRVERMMHQLRLAGILPSLKGLIVGQFTRYHLGGQLTSTATDTQQQLYRMIAHMVEPYDYPVAFGFPAGHVDRNLPLILGAPTGLQVTSAGTTVAPVQPSHMPPTYE